VKIFQIQNDEADKILALEESHFSDLKSKRISPSKLSRTISAMANADGGEILAIMHLATLFVKAPPSAKPRRLFKPYPFSVGKSLSASAPHHHSWPPPRVLERPELCS
jgi:hypothetical protein